MSFRPNQTNAVQKNRDKTERQKEARRETFRDNDSAFLTPFLSLLFRRDMSPVPAKGKVGAITKARKKMKEAMTRHWIVKWKGRQQTKQSQSRTDLLSSTAILMIVTPQAYFLYSLERSSEVKMLAVTLCMYESIKNARNCPFYFSCLVSLIHDQLHAYGLCSCLFRASSW